MAAYLRATDRADIARAGRAAPRSTCVADPEVLTRPREVLRRGRRDRPLRARAAHRRPALAGPGAADLEARGRGRRTKAGPDQISRRADRLLHQLLLRGHEARRRTSPMQALKAGLKAKTPFLVTPGLGAASTRPSSATGMMDTLRRRSAAPCSPTPAGRASGSGSASDVGSERDQHHRHLVQPQLPRPQRRQRRDAVLHRPAPRS